MEKAGIAPDKVTSSTLVAPANGYGEALQALGELNKLLGKNPGEGELTAVLSKVADFDDALRLVIEFRGRGYFTGRAVYEAVFAKPITKFSSSELLSVYNGLPFKFDSSPQSPLRQYRSAGQLDEAFIISLAAPHTEAMQKFY